MRIAIITEVFTPKIDGIVTRLTHTVDQLAGLGHDVLVIAPGPGPVDHNGVRVLRTPSTPFKHYPGVHIGWPTKAIISELTAFNPDIIHAVGPVALGAWGVGYARAKKLPLLASYHTEIGAYTEDFGLPHLRGPAESWIISLHNRADVNLCPSLPLVQSATSAGMARVGLWPKAVDTDLFRPTRFDPVMRERLTNGTGMPLVLSVGRLSHEKNLAALRPLLDKLNICLAFVGDGPAQGELRSLFAQTPTVFTGPLRGTELASAFASADVFAFPSLTDTLGNVAFEAMASGLPVVGANAGGIPDIVSHGVNGFLADPASPQFSTYIEAIAFHPDIRGELIAGALATARGQSWRKATETVVDHYKVAILRSARKRASRIPADVLAEALREPGPQSR